ncbi:hypothetical protein [Shewanella sp. 10N.286.51.B7]|uniref:hypothetical protein n=1 Tax=Shewanella sp. 10N.286.51.B7 TaxID=1880836 RepID=UPI0010549323|nr:hypothetical protein [Shewanella sp. 10N.286.51.B7]
MKLIKKLAARITTCIILCGLTFSSVQAHMMVAQHGTINLVDDGAFMVLSLPVSAFHFLDNSLIELDDSDAADGSDGSDGSDDADKKIGNISMSNLSIDQNNDGKLSSDELQQHRQQISRIILQRVSLSDATGPLPLQGLIISLASHGSPKQPSDQIIVMGRFKLNNSQDPLIFENQLFGKSFSEQVIDMSVTRQEDKQKQVFQVSANAPSHRLFPAK